MIRQTSIISEATRAADFSSKKATARLRKHAYESGWPTELSRVLSVTHSDGEFNVSYPEDLSEKVLDTEFGTVNSQPNPAIRNFMGQIDDHLYDYDNALVNVLNKMEL